MPALMVESNQDSSAPLQDPPIRRPVRMEFEADGSVLIWIDPRRFNVSIVNGRGSGGTAELYTRVIISPWLAQATGIIDSSAHSRETEMTK